MVCSFSYIIAQLIGGILGATLVYLFYLPHYAATDDANAKLATFCTGPAIRNAGLNLFCEVLGTFVLLLGVIYKSSPEGGLGSLDAQTPLHRIDSMHR